MNKKTLYKVALAATFVVGISGALFTWVGSDEGVGDEKRPVREGYCPQCDKPLPQNGECFYCKMQQIQGKAPPPAPGFWSNLTVESKAAVFIFLMLATVVVACWSWLPRIPWLPPKVEVFYHFKCPRCKRKLRYPAAKVGKYGICPGCHQRAVFPDPSRETGMHLQNH